MEKTNNKPQERNYGIDLFRMLSMYMVLILHLLYHGGILTSAEPLSANYWAAWLLETFSYCAVNCFALISGYVMCRQEPRLSRIMELWIQTVFYGFVISIIMFKVFPETRNIEMLLTAFVPFSSQKYWYLSAYFGMYLLLPVLNIAIAALTRVMFKRFLVIVLIFMSVIPTIINKDPYFLSKGYSVLWLCILYLLGGYIKVYKVEEKISAKKCIFLAGLIATLTFFSKVIIEYSSKRIFGEIRYGETLISYTSPTIVLYAVLLLLFFSQITICPVFRKLIKITGPATVAVYMIHSHEILKSRLLQDKLLGLLDYNGICMGVLILIVGLTVFSACVAIDLVRIQLFKLCRVRNLCVKCESYFDRLRL